MLLERLSVCLVCSAVEDAETYLEDNKCMKWENLSIEPLK